MVFWYDPQMKRQSAIWKSPLSPRKKKKTVTGQVKRQGDALTVFRLVGIVHFERTSLTVYAIQFVVSILNFGTHKNWLLLHDNAPSHRSVLFHLISQGQHSKQKIKKISALQLAVRPTYFENHWTMKENHIRRKRNSMLLMVIKKTEKEDFSFYLVVLFILVIVTWVVKKSIIMNRLRSPAADKPEFVLYVYGYTLS